MDGARGIIEGLPVDNEFVDRLLAAQVTEVESRQFARQPMEVIAFTMLVIQSRIGQLKPASGANTPSATIPAYEKPTPLKSKNKRQRGGQPGHKGRTRQQPVEPDRVRHQRLDDCAGCGTKLILHAV